MVKQMRNRIWLKWAIHSLLFPVVFFQHYSRKDKRSLLKPKNISHATEISRPIGIKPFILKVKGKAVDN